ncbi:transcription factor bHLH110 isoform X1 [Cajanus cajan]|uniref:transcription factor bHLH110 isoform X1 n=1 Tax=Cajanus cajan TaxID=3821 RepID=UPI00098DBEAB|nr:transcription factor bHLH110 isoform X1 [Cajanus cajan]XP_020231943.1 transcription factor bHLH110 isoform X1 [Cajanus cajan]
MSETSPSTIDIAKMRNALLSSISSRLHCYGNNEVQLDILERSMQMNDLINDFNMESRMFNNDSQLGKGDYTQPSQSQSLIYDHNHHPGSLYGIPSSKDISQQSLLLDKDPFLSQYERVYGKARKSPFEYTGNMPLWKKMKSKITIMEPKWYQTKEVPEIIPPHNLHVPMKRNQKLSDKVTTLQRLVSPFGKTDTASVLHEASINIKLLQAQIRTLFQMLSFSYFSTIKDPHTQECGDQLQVDLRSRGLCLVPISITEKVTMVDQIHHDSTSRIIHP